MRPLIISRLVAALVLLTCVFCPLVEMFDRWDNTLQNGSDTEYTFVVLALCLGVLYAFTRFLFRCFLLRTGAKTFAESMSDLACARMQGCFSSPIRISISPPLTSLRV